MADFTIARDDRQTGRTKRTRVGDVRSLVLDFGPWADDYGALTACTWQTMYGDAAVSAAALVGNVSTVTLTTATVGQSLIRATATDGTYTTTVNITVVVADPALTGAPTDYWPMMC